jgi:hypothetical protein
MLRFWMLTGAFGLILAGCATTAPPVEVVRAFASASDAFNAASQPLLDEVAVAERERALKLIKSPPENAKNVLVVPGLPGGVTRRLLLDLPIDQVLALSTISDPPATALFRNGAGTIKRYAAVLVLLAEGQNIEAARAELGILATNLAGIVALVPVPGAAAAPALVGPALSALQPLIDSAARALNAAELRRLVVEAAPSIKALNDALRNGAEPLFDAIAGGSRDVIIEGGDPAAAVDRIDAYRVVLANWLVLLELIDQANDQLVATMLNPANTATLASLAELSTRITTYAEGARRALAIIRAGKQP